MTVTAKGTQPAQSSRDSRFEGNLRHLCWATGDMHWEFYKEADADGVKQEHVRYVPYKGPVLTHKNARDIAVRLRRRGLETPLGRVTVEGLSHAHKAVALRTLFGDILTEEMYQHLAATMRPQVKEIVLVRCPTDRLFSILVWI